MKTSVFACVAVAFAWVPLNAEPVPKSDNAKSAAPDPLFEKSRIAVRRKLKDPASARFDELEIKKVGGDTAVCGLVNAKNSMGGYTGRKLFVYVAATNLAYLLELTDDFNENQAISKNIERFCVKS